MFSLCAQPLATFIVSQHKWLTWKKRARATIASAGYLNILLLVNATDEDISEKLEINYLTTKDPGTENINKFQDSRLG